MLCKNCGKEIPDGADRCQDCTESSGVCFWVTLAVLLLWQLLTIVRPCREFDSIFAAEAVMAGAGGVTCAVLTAVGIIDARRIGASACISIMVVYVAFYACFAVGCLAMIRSGLWVYDGAAAVQRICDAADLEPLWLWAAVIFTGLAKSGRIKKFALAAVISAVILLAVSGGAFLYLRESGAMERDFADIYIVSRLSVLWLTRLGTLAAAWAWATGRVRGMTAVVVCAGAPLCAGALAILAGTYFPAEAVFWAEAAVYAGFALVGAELAVMKRGADRT